MRLVAALCLLAGPSLAQAKLEIRDVQTSHGQLGPERKSNEYIAGDQVYFRYTVAGFRLDEEGRIRGELRLTVKGAEGKKKLDRKVPLQQVVALGGETMPAFASFNLDEDFPPGEYELTVELTDRLLMESASFQRKIICKAEEFALVQVRFYQDAAGEVPARVGGTVSQTLFVKLKAVGFDHGRDEIDIEMEMTVLDEAGKPVVPKPIRAGFHNEKPDEVKKIDRINLSGTLTLNRAGNFRLRIAVTDKLTKKKVFFEAPLGVSPL
jgi:hypothetical protein